MSALALLLALQSPALDAFTSALDAHTICGFTAMRAENVRAGSAADYARRYDRECAATAGALEQSIADLEISRGSSPAQAARRAIDEVARARASFLATFERTSALTR